MPRNETRALQTCNDDQTNWKMVRDACHDPAKMPNATHTSKNYKNARSGSEINQTQRNHPAVPLWLNWGHCRFILEHDTREFAPV